MSFFCVVSGSPDMRACRAESESVRKTAFLGFSFVRKAKSYRQLCIYISIHKVDPETYISISKHILMCKHRKDSEN